MKISYDPEVDALSVRHVEAEIVDSEQVHPGVILDYDNEENVVAIEVLHAKERAQDILKVAGVFKAWAEGQGDRGSPDVKAEDLELLRSLRLLPEEVRRPFERTIREQAKRQPGASDARPARRA